MFTAWNPSGERLCDDLGLLLDVDDLAPIVVAAGSANAVGHAHLAAVGADYEAGGVKLPVGIAPFISSGL